jgi:membrane-associated PAP2 superfamily phosphatase
MNPRPFLKHDLAVTLLALALLLTWDFGGQDLNVARLFGSAQGFAWRDSFVFSTLLHEGGRAGAWLVMAALVFATWRWGRQGPGRAERLRWLGVMLLCVVAVPALKRFSATSCPWDLAEFGGVARYISHWDLGVVDGGGGHCFPSGHAVAAFAFFGQYFLWRGHDIGRARLWLAGVLAAGLLVGTAQLVRGAHYPSHTLWSAWLCWAICVAAAAAFPTRVQETGS